MARAILSILMLACLNACSDNTPSSPSESIDGVWRILSLQRPSQPVQPAPVGAQYQIGFDDQRVSLRVDCNTCTGPFTVSGDTLTIGPTLACTRAACATADYESAVLALLNGEHRTASTLHNLTLSSSRGSILLQR